MVNVGGAGEQQVTVSYVSPFAEIAMASTDAELLVELSPVLPPGVGTDWVASVEQRLADLEARVAALEG